MRLDKINIFNTLLQTFQALLLERDEAGQQSEVTREKVLSIKELTTGRAHSTK